MIDKHRGTFVPFATSGSGCVPMAQDPLTPAVPPHFVVLVERSDDQVVLRARGELDIATAPKLEKAMAGVDHAQASVRLDMSKVTFMDSTGLRLLILATEQAQLDGREFSIVPSAAVTKVVTAVGLTQFLPLNT